MTNAAEFISSHSVSTAGRMETQTFQNYSCNDFVIWERCISQSASTMWVKPESENEDLSNAQSNSSFFKTFIRHVTLKNSTNNLIRKTGICFINILTLNKIIKGIAVVSKILNEYID